MKNEKIRIGSDYSGVGAYNHNLKRCGIDYEEVFACDFNLYARISFLSTFGTEDDLKLAKSKDHKQFAAEVERICLGESLLDGDTQKLVLYFANEFAKKFSFYYPFNVYDREIPSESLDEYMTSPPCQAFSLAGKREGKESLKGILFFNSHEFIDKNRPRFFRFENVKGLLSDDGGRTFQEWINMLGGKSVNGVPVLFPDENSVPYHIYWRVLNAKDYNIPQNRERVFIVGIRDDEDNVFQWPREMFLDRKLKDVLEDEVDPKYFLSEITMQRLKDQRDNKSNNFSVKDVTDMDISPTIISGGTSPKDKQHVIKVTGVTNNNGNLKESDIANCIDANYHKGIDSHSQRTHVKSEVIQLNPSKESGGKQPYKQNRVYDANGVSPTLDTECGRPGYLVGTWRTHNDGQGFREMKDGLCPTIPARAREDGSGQPVIMQLPRGNNSGGYHKISPTITSNSYEQNNLLKVNSDYSIRRLIPLECWRLMDFPDQSLHNAVDAGIKDSQLYKQAGNSIPVGLLVGITKGLKCLVNKHENI